MIAICYILIAFVRTEEGASLGEDLGDRWENFAF